MNLTRQMTIYLFHEANFDNVDNEHNTCKSMIFPLLIVVAS